MWELPKNYLGYLSVRVIVEGCLQSCARGPPRRLNTAQQLGKQVLFLQFSRWRRGRTSLTHKDRTKGKRCVVRRDLQRTCEITKESFKNLPSPGNVKASYNSTSQVGTFLFPYLSLSPPRANSRGVGHSSYGVRKEVSKKQKRSFQDPFTHEVTQL